MRDPLHWIPVKYKLAAVFVGLCVLAFGVGGYVVLGSAKDALEREIRDRLEFQSRTYATALDGYLRMLGRRAEDFASDGYIRAHVSALAVASDPGERLRLQIELRDHLSRNKLPLVDAFSALDVVDQSGTLLTSTSDLADSRPPAGAREPIATGTISTSPLQTASNGTPVFLLSTTLHSIDGTRIVGSLIAHVLPGTWICGALDDAGLRAATGDEVGLSLIDGRAATLRVSPSLTRRDGPGAASEAAREGVGLHLEAVAPLPGTARNVLRITHPIARSGWKVEVERDLSPELGAVAGLQSRFLAAGLALTAGAALLLFFPMRFLARPLVRMKDAAQRIKDGEFSARVAVESTDEIGELARSFNLMAEAVQERTSRLEEAAETLRSQKNEVKRESERLAAVISSMHDGLVVLDAAGQAVLSNSAAAPILRLLHGEGTGHGHHTCRQDEGCARCLFDLQSAPRDCVMDIGSGVFEIRTTRLPPDDHGRSGRVLVSRDISDRVAQDERQIHQERLAVLGEVAAVMAHELNNPLASVNLYAQMLETELPSDSQAREGLTVIRRNVDACKRSIRELLDYATGASPEVAAVDVHAVLNDVARFLRPVRERSGVACELDLVAGFSEVNGDEVQLRQIFINLVVNAIQAIGPHTGRVMITSRTKGDFLEVDIADEGPGIPPEARDAVFRPFFTTKPRGEGTGLGLPTARRIAEMHGGTLELVRSVPGETVFRVRLRLRNEVAV